MLVLKANCLFDLGVLEEDGLVGLVSVCMVCKPQMSADVRTQFVVGAHTFGKDRECLFILSFGDQPSWT